MLHILEALAQIDIFETVPIAKLVQNESQNLAWGSTIVVITAMPTDALYSTLLNIKRGGRRVVLIVVGGTEPSIMKDVLTVYHIKEDIAWRELEMLSIKGV
jgi:hypothetical protein